MCVAVWGYLEAEQITSYSDTPELSLSEYDVNWHVY